MTGRDVTVLRPAVAGRDSMGEPVVEWLPEVVHGCLWSFSTAGTGPEHPHGAKLTVTVHFPRWYGKPLKGCRVEIGGDEFAVVGDPRPLMECNCPTPWSMAVEGERVA